MFFTSKGGYIYNAAIDWETGKITDFKSLALKDAEGYTSEEKPGAIMSTCTPSVYNGRHLPRRFRQQGPVLPERRPLHRGH